MKFVYTTSTKLIFVLLNIYIRDILQHCSVQKLYKIVTVLKVKLVIILPTEEISHIPNSGIPSNQQPAYTLV